MTKTKKTLTIQKHRNGRSCVYSAREKGKLTHMDWRWTISSTPQSQETKATKTPNNGRKIVKIKKSFSNGNQN